MADITNELAKILSAKYGEEVRGSIHDALVAMNTNAEDAELWAHGTTGGTPSATNNAAFYAAQAATSAATLKIDSTLSRSGQAADAKAAGDILLYDSENIIDETFDQANNSDGNGKYCHIVPKLESGKRYEFSITLNGFNSTQLGLISKINFYSSATGSALVDSFDWADFFGDSPVEGTEMTGVYTPTGNITYFRIIFYPATYSSDSNTSDVVVDRLYSVRDELEVADGRLDNIEQQISDSGIFKYTALTGWSNISQSKYARLGNISVGANVQINTPSTAGWQYLMVECQPGDEFIVTGTGSSAPRAYGFADSDNKLVFASPSNTNVTNLLVTAPEGAAYLYVDYQSLDNPPTAAPDSYRRTKLSDSISAAFPLTGKKIVNFGDSIFGNYRADSGENESISHMLETLTGAKCYNVAMGGTHSGDTQGDQKTSTWQYDFTYIVTAIIDEDFTEQDNGGKHADAISILKTLDFSKIDIITISYGTNDWSYNTNQAVYKANLIDGITRMQTAFPNLLVMVCTPIIRFKGSSDNSEAEEQDQDTGINYTSDDDEMDKSVSHKIPGFAEKCEEIAHEYHLGFCENYWHLGVNLANRATFFGENGTVHPNRKGRRLIAGRLAAELNKMY